MEAICIAENDNVLGSFLGPQLMAFFFFFDNDDDDDRIELVTEGCCKFNPFDIRSGATPSPLGLLSP